MYRLHLFRGAAVVLLSANLSLAHADPRVAEARTIVKEFASALQGELKTAMQTGGPVKAVEVCHSRAPAIAAELSEKHGWEVGRTSLKRRNVYNTPDAWEVEQMRQFESRKAAGEAVAQLEVATTVASDGRQAYRYMKAIPTQEICLACHGADSVGPEVAAKIQEYYPDDRARGFAAGDIRGAFTLTKKP